MGNVCTPNGYCEPLSFGPDASNSSGIDANLGCPSTHFSAMPVIPTVQLLIDQSGSMSTTFGNTTRWDAIKNALTDPSTGVVTNLQSEVIFGASLFTGSGSTCPRLLSSSDRQLNNGAEIATLLADNGPAGNTPTGASIDAVVQDFANNPPMMGSPPIIVIATDGEPNDCGDNGTPTQQQTAASEQHAITSATAAFTAGIQLYVLGVGSDTDMTNLQAMANVGLGQDATTGTATAYSALDPASLATAFQTIINGTRSCDLTLTGQIITSQANTGMVTLDGNNLAYGAGWTIVVVGGADTSSTIRLIGTACDTLLTEAAPVVDAYFPCGAIFQ